ncbi:hypothetical protein DVH05_024606 [Phytophthora capsici]|nr:hypothetical protein DVH05_024606 [Phytophthora capsici]
MDAQTGWLQRGSGGGGMRRPGATSAMRTAPDSSRAPSTTAHPRTAPAGAYRTSNQAKERSVNGRKNVSTEPVPAASRWREMRQSVRTKATLETTNNRPVNATIADLCPEDREKVAKLMRRIVELGTLHEEGEKEFQRQREVQADEVKELREQIRQDAEEIKELSDELRSARRKAQLFEDRVLVLEESTDAETRARLEAEQTLDLLKLEVDKLRALVKRQQDDMHQETKEQREAFYVEMQQMKDELMEARELLLKERSERLLDKQKALDQSLERSATVGEDKLDRLHSLLLQQQEELHHKAKEQQEEMMQKTREQQQRFKSEIDELKQQLKETQAQLLHERNCAVLEKERAEAISDVQVAATNLPTISPIDQVPSSPKEKRPGSGPGHFVSEIQGDLAMFEEVKDLYAEDFFASRRWGGGLNVANTTAPSRDQHLEAASRVDLPRTDEFNARLGPLSTQELSVQDAIERDVEALLRSEALH